MEEKRSPFTKRLGIAATVVSLTGGSIALWNQLKPEKEVPDLTGTWVITDRIETASDTSYISDTHEYEVVMNQDGAILNGTGKQKKYNGKHAVGRWPIRIEGRIHEQEVRATLHVDNPAGGFDGSLYLNLNEGGQPELTGTIRTTVAEQRGPAEVRIER